MIYPLGPILVAAITIGIGAVIGMYPIQKLIQIQEAKHELKQGSASFFRTTVGWMVIVLWLAAVWFVMTIIGDWWATGDLDGAIERSGRRLRLLLTILQAIGDD